jgi:monolysocardiolipin acyltransferase
MGALLPWQALCEPRLLPWTVAAQDICFSDPVRGAFFANGKLLPVDRRAGTGQPLLRPVAARLAAGHWVHIFPEGRVSRTGDVQPFKRGAAVLLRNSAGGAPVHVLAVFHDGTHRILPAGGRVPRRGQTVRVAVGRVTPYAELAADDGDADAVTARLAAAVAALCTAARSGSLVP